MNFNLLKTSIISILAAGSALLPTARQFDVLQAQRQKSGAKDIKIKKKVMVYFVSDDFQETSGTANGEVQSRPVFRIIPTVSAGGQFTDATDPASLQSAEIVADNEWDILAADIYQIIMDATKMDLGLAVGQVSNRYIKNISKTDINPEGDNAVITGQMDLTCHTPEQVAGETGVTGTNVLNTLTMDGDTVAKSAVTAP